MGRFESKPGENGTFLFLDGQELLWVGIPAEDLWFEWAQLNISDPQQLDRVLIEKPIEGGALNNPPND